MWWSPLQRPRPTRRPDGGCTLVESDDLDVPAFWFPAVFAAPMVADDRLHTVALLAAHAHAEGAPITGALAAVAILHKMTVAGDPRRFQAWLLQGLYHRLAGAEAEQSRRGAAVVRAHIARARGVLRLAATSPDPATRRRARTALGQL